jgi:predicted ATPase
MERIAQMRQDLAAWRVTGVEFARPCFLAALAKAHRKVGQAKRSRLQRELLLRQTIPDEQQAGICFSEGCAIARRQQAKLQELRAAIDLSRLWQRQGKWDEARALLAPIYGWFTESVDTADLQEAKVLLEELS